MGNKRNFILILFFLISSPLIFAQRKKKLNTNGQGTFYALAGYNRSVYTKTNTTFEAEKYNFTLQSLKIKDNKEAEGLKSFFSSSSPQLNIQLGYFIKNKWAITVGYNRYNTFFVSPQDINIKGTFAPGSHSDYTGSYDEMIELKKNQFNLSQRYGINYFSLGLQRNDMLGRTKSAEFALHLLYGIKFGSLLTKIDYTFDNQTTQNISSFSGFGISSNIGIRLDFYQHLFLQFELNGGMLLQNNIRLSSDGNEKAKQNFGFLSPSINLGISIFANSKNNCATCPQW